MSRLQTSREERRAAYRYLAVQEYHTYLSTNNLRHIEGAIQMARQALLWGDETDKIEWASELYNLGTFLECRFERLGRQDDLEEAIAVTRRAVQVTPEDSTNLASRLKTLGNKLQRRFERLGRLEDLEEVIAVTTAGGPSHAGR